METSILEDAAALAAMGNPVDPVLNPIDDLDSLRGIILGQYKAGLFDSFAFVAADKLIARVRRHVADTINEAAPDDRASIEP